MRIRIYVDPELGNRISLDSTCPKTRSDKFLTDQSRTGRAATSHGLRWARLTQDERGLKPLELGQNRLALSIGVPPRRINEIVLGKRRVTAETALRLPGYFDTTPQF